MWHKGNTGYLKSITEEHTVALELMAWNSTLELDLSSPEALAPGRPLLVLLSMFLVLRKNHLLSYIRTSWKASFNLVTSPRMMMGRHICQEENRGETIPHHELMLCLLGCPSNPMHHETPWGKTSYTSRIVEKNQPYFAF